MRSKTLSRSMIVMFLLTVMLTLQANGGVVTSLGNTNEIYQITATPLNGTAEPRATSTPHPKTIATLKSTFTPKPTSTPTLMPPYHEVVRIGNGNLSSTVWRPDGKALYVLTNLSLSIYDENLQLVSQIVPPTGIIRSASWNPNSSQLAYTLNDGTVHLVDGLTGADLKTLKGHKGSISALLWDEVSSELITAGSDKTIRVWDTTSGEQKQILEGSLNPIAEAVLSPQRNKLATRDSKGIVTIWDGENSWHPVTLNPEDTASHISKITKLVFSPNGFNIATIGEKDPVVRLWDTTTGKQYATIYGHTTPVTQVTWNQTGEFLISSAEKENLHIWRADTGEIFNVIFDDPENARLWKLSPDETHIMAYGKRGTIMIYDVNSALIMRAYTELPGAIVSAQWFPDSQRVITSNSAGLIRIWDTRSGKTIGDLRGHDFNVTSTLFNKELTRLLSMSGDGRLVLWNLGDYQQISEITGLNVRTVSLSWSPDGKYLATGGNDRILHIWNVASGKEAASFAGHVNSITAVAWSPNGQLIATGSADRTVRVWDLSNGHQINRIAVADSAPTALAWNLRSNQLLIGSRERSPESPDPNKLVIYDINKKALIVRFLGDIAAVTDVAWGSDGTISSAHADGTLYTWNLDNQQFLVRYKANDTGINTIAWSADYRFVAQVSTKENLFEVIDGKLGQKTRTIPTENNPAGLAWSSTGTIAIGVSTGVQMWNSETMTALGLLKGHIGSVVALKWSADGSQLASTGADGTIRIWSMN